VLDSASDFVLAMAQAQAQAQRHRPARRPATSSPKTSPSCHPWQLAAASPFLLVARERCPTSAAICSRQAAALPREVRPPSRLRLDCLHGNSVFSASRRRPQRTGSMKWMKRLSASAREPCLASRIITGGFFTPPVLRFAKISRPRTAALADDWHSDGWLAGNAASRRRLRQIVGRACGKFHP